MLQLGSEQGQACSLGIRKSGLCNDKRQKIQNKTLQVEYRRYIYTHTQCVYTEHKQKQLKFQNSNQGITKEVGKKLRHMYLLKKNKR